MPRDKNLINQRILNTTSGYSFYVTSLLAVLWFCLIFLGASSLQAADDKLPLPRFVSLRAEEVNVRTGPGVRYPINWVFHKRDLPVEIVAEFENWRKVRDVDQAEGWVHQSMLSGRRSIVIVGGVRDLKSDPTAASTAIARLEPGVVLGDLLRLRKPRAERLQQRRGGKAAHREPRRPLEEAAAIHCAVDVLVKQIPELLVEVARLFSLHTSPPGRAACRVGHDLDDSALGQQRTRGDSRVRSCAAGDSKSLPVEWAQVLAM